MVGQNLKKNIWNMESGPPPMRQTEVVPGNQLRLKDSNYCHDVTYRLHLWVRCLWTHSWFWVIFNCQISGEQAELVQQAGVDYGCGCGCLGSVPLQIMIMKSLSMKSSTLWHGSRHQCHLSKCLPGDTEARAPQGSHSDLTSYSQD